MFMVHEGNKDNKLIQQLLQVVNIVLPRDVHPVLYNKTWGGMILAMIVGPWDNTLVAHVIGDWRPMEVLLAVHCTHPEGR